MSRYDDRAGYYARFRPGYPAALRDALLASGHLKPSDVVADVGSGTGLLAEMFLAAGCRVYGVEPGPGMRAAAAARLGGAERFVPVDGCAEATTLPDGSVDLAAAGQAFHWFDPAAARVEFLRILKRPARVLLVWNVRRPDASAFMAGYETLLLAHATDRSGISGHDPDESALRRFFGGPLPPPLSFPHHQVLDAEGLRGRLLSSSFLPTASDPGGPAMLDALDRLFGEHRKDGVVRFEYETRAWAGTIAP